jgi:hypothetical protein
MRSKQQQPSPNPAPIYRSINTCDRSESDVAKHLSGAAGEAALSAAALQQLTRYADDIQNFLEESRMNALLDQLQADLDCLDSGFDPKSGPPRN